MSGVLVEMAGPLPPCGVLSSRKLAEARSYVRSLPGGQEWKGQGLLRPGLGTQQCHLHSVGQDCPDSRVRKKTPLLMGRVTKNLCRF